MSKEYYLKCGELTGHAQAIAMQRIIAEAMEYLAIKKALEEGAHEPYGLTKKEYIKSRLGDRSYDTYKRRESEINLLGADLWSIKKYMGWGPAEVQALAALPEGDKSKIKIKDNEIEFGNQKIPLEKAAIQETFSALTNRADDAEKDKKALERVNENLHKSLEKAHREISRMEKRTTMLKENPNTLEEDFITQLEGVRLSFNKFIGKIAPDNMEVLMDEDDKGNEKEIKPTIRMKAAYIELLGFISKIANASYTEAEERFGSAAMAPDKVWKPGMK